MVKKNALQGFFKDYTIVCSGMMVFENDGGETLKQV